MTHPFPTARARAALLCLLGLAGAQAAAQTAARTAGPPAADPQAAVPATAYRNPIRYRVEPPPATRPDRNWRDSNAIVAGTDAMSLTMPDMAGHAAHTGHAAPATEAAPSHHHPGMAMPAAPQEEQR